MGHFQGNSEDQNANENVNSKDSVYEVSDENAESVENGTRGHMC